MSDYVVCNEQEAIMNTYMPMNTNSLMYMFPSCTYIHMLSRGVPKKGLVFFCPVLLSSLWPAIRPKQKPSLSYVVLARGNNCGK